MVRLEVREKRKKELLKTFGSVEGIKKATFEELRKILPEKVVLLLQEHLKGDE